jgi:thiamine-phosphate pyrophosphorylase
MGHPAGSVSHRGQETMSGSAAPELQARLAAARLYVVTSAAQPPAVVEDVVRSACAGGADIVQLRRKGDDDVEWLRLAERCRALTAEAGALFVVNDRLDVAMACDADGVHLGQDDLPLSVARRLWPGRIVGRSTHSLAQALDAGAQGADYIGVGPVYATPTKPGRAAVGLEVVTAVASSGVRVPWFAIGGIDEDTAGAVIAAGAHRIAVVRAVSDAVDVEAATRGLGAMVRRAGAVSPEVAAWAR